jgi:hypothetical protein
VSQFNSANCSLRSWFSRSGETAVLLALQFRTISLIYVISLCSLNWQFELYTARDKSTVAYGENSAIANEYKTWNDIDMNMRIDV